MWVEHAGKWMARAAVTLGAFAASSAALAQGCAMCYTSAAAAKAGALQALRDGILILLVPPLVMFGMIAVVIFRRRNQFHERGEWSPDHDQELRAMLARLEPVEAEDLDSSRVEHSHPVS